MTEKITQDDLEQELVEEILRFENDPYGFALYAFPWGEEGTELADYEGPDEWQTWLLKAVGEGLLTPNEAIQIAIASGHGIGKSCVVALLILWALSTMPNTKGVVTANTESQLRTKTWPEVGKWFGMMINKHWFKYTATAIHLNDPSPEKQKKWRMDCIPWSEHNTEAFAGLHNKGARILIIFDEASAVADKIWEVTEGALTDEDTQIIWCAFGNPTRSTGRFHACFTKYRHRWITRQIDSRTVKMTNKAQLQKWVDDYGIDSDFVKVRVRGIFPPTSDRQFIPTNSVDGARGKAIGEHQHSFAPVIIGVDPAWSGVDEIAIVMRQGLVAKVLATYRNVQDDMVIAGYVAQFEDQYKADGVFIDLGYGTGIQSAGKAMGRRWTLVSFAAAPTKQGYLNKRAEMWGDVKDWLKEGGCLPDDPVLCEELCGPEYQVRLDGKIQLEGKEDMKKRGVASPNRADALCLTFAYPVSKKAALHRPEFADTSSYDPFA